MTEGLPQLAQRIVQADRLFLAGQFEESLRHARSLLAEVMAVPHACPPHYRAELLGLIGRCALHLCELDEALDATRAALHAVHALQDEMLDPLLEGIRENLLTILAAREGPAASPDTVAAPTHRELRTEIARAQSLTDRHRFAQSIQILEPLATRLELLGKLPISTLPPPEPDDPRLFYLPRVLGLLGSNWYYLGDRGRSRVLVDQAVAASRALGDRTGGRIDPANLEVIALGLQHEGA